MKKLNLQSGFEILMSELFYGRFAHQDTNDHTPYNNENPPIIVLHNEFAS